MYLSSSNLTRAALLGAVAATTAGSASAEVHVFNSGLSTITTGSVFFDLDGGTSSTTSFAGANFELIHTGGVTPSAKIISGPAGGSISCAGRLIAGETVGPFETYGTPLTLAPDGEFSLPDHAYLGLVVHTDVSTVNFGWAEVTLASDAKITLNQFAYETTPNTSIVVGVAAPEPDPLALMALGAVGMGAYRLRVGKTNAAKVKV